MNRSVKITSAVEQPVRPASALRIDTIALGPSDWVPNHPDLPVLVYHEACQGLADLAHEFETRFAANGWQGIWRDGVFDYHHYHTQAHEVLGIAAGRARLLIGGPSGREISVNAGDCLVLPAGTGHKRIDASRDFLVVGAYPPAQEPDIQTGAASEEQLRRIASVPLPPADPLEGAEGSLARFWRSRR